MGHEIGSIEPGKKADFALYDTRRVEWATLFNPVNSLVYNADGRSVHTVVVDGRVVVENHRPLFVDEPALISEVQAVGENLLSRAGLVIPSALADNLNRRAHFRSNIANPGGWAMSQLVLIHGPSAGGCAASFRYQLAQFPDALAPDLPGHLDSESFDNVVGLYLLAAGMAAGAGTFQRADAGRFHPGRLRGPGLCTNLARRSGRTAANDRRHAPQRKGAGRAGVSPERRRNPKRECRIGWTIWNT